MRWQLALGFVLTTLVATVLWPNSAASTPQAFPKGVTPPRYSTDDKTAVKVRPMVVLVPGEEQTITIGWVDGTGRAPAYFLSDSAQTRPEDLNNLEGVPEHVADGIELKLDEALAHAALQPVIGSELQGKQRDGTFHHFTNFALQVKADENAQRGLYRRYVHNISGTGRSMFLSAEILVVVKGDKSD